VIALGASLLASSTDRCDDPRAASRSWHFDVLVKQGETKEALEEIRRDTAIRAEVEGTQGSTRRGEAEDLNSLPESGPS